MSKKNKIVLPPAESTNRRQPLLQSQQSKNRVGEVVGGTAAECVAVCCCCPCSLANFLVLTIYKLPAGLCRKMLKNRRRRRLLKEGLLSPTSNHRGRHHCSCGCCDGTRINPLCENDASDFENLHYSVEPDKDTMALEKEMWDTFYGTGFWRSPSRRVTDSPQMFPKNLEMVIAQYPQSPLASKKNY